MTRHWASLITLLVLLTTSVHGKDKKKILPAYVLQARTVLVVVDPDAGISLLDPNANRIAQENVEKALGSGGASNQSWTRKLRILLSVFDAARARR